MRDAERAVRGNVLRYSGEFRVRPPLQMIHNVTSNLPSASALRVIELLSQRGPQPACSLAEIRRRYTESRKPLLARPAAVESIIHVRSNDVRPLTVFRPSGQESGKLLPAIVYLHGGGWSVGTLQTYDPLCRQLANATGSIVIYVDYRLAPEHPFPAAFDDARQALRYVHDNYAWLGIDPHRIGVGGDSAGGNIAAAICLAERNDSSAYQLAFQILLYPCLDMMACMPSHKELSDGYVLTSELYRWYRQNYLGGFEKPGHWRLSPLFAHDVGGLPPAVILYAGFDPLRDEAAAYAERLRRAGGKVQTLYFPDMIHGFMALGGAIPEAEAGFERVASALDILLGD
jgi:acetyl esterase